MSEMVERVARAMAGESGCVVSQQFDAGTGRLVDTKEEWKNWIPFARAALAAMREPTEKMTIAGSLRSDYSGTAEDAGNQWRVMIDAALEEKP
jgi:hypothetical protein